MRAIWLIVAAAFTGFADLGTAADYVYSDAFETRICDGVDCSYCSPVDPLPLCGTHSHCLPQQDASSMCTYPDGSGGQAAQCSSDAECSGPYACVDTGVLKCAHWCTRPSGNECQSVPGTTCVGFASALLIGQQEWGVCL